MSGPAELPPIPAPAALESAAGNLRRKANALAALSRLGAAPDPTRVRRELDRIDSEPAVDLKTLSSTLHRWLDAEARTRRHRLAAELRTACDAAGVSARVVGKEPLELRLAPVSVWVDVAADTATVRFARQVVGRCRATAEAILTAREEALKTLDGSDWSAPDFHRRLRVAWSRVGRDFVPVGDVLPELALVMQSDAWRREPSAAHFKAYPRVQLAYDLHRLRRDRALMVDGWRLCLASATGGSLRDKHAVLWVEDADGQGSFMHLIRFEQDRDDA